MGQRAYAERGVKNKFTNYKIILRKIGANILIFDDNLKYKLKLGAFDCFFIDLQISHHHTCCPFSQVKNKIYSSLNSFRLKNSNIYP